jgi:hypothetical protein
LLTFVATSLHGQENRSIGKHYADRNILLPPDSEDFLFPAAVEAFDVNGDGRDDILFSGWGEHFTDPAPLVIWTANESGTMDVSTEELVVGGIPSVGQGFRQIIPSDYNGDGHLDLFLETHGPEGDCGDGTHSCWPGGQNNLLLADGNGQLQNVTATHLPELMDFSHGSTVADFDADGDVDIWVNSIGNSPLQDVDFSFLLFNDGEGKFTVVADNSPEWYDNRIIGPNGILPDIVWIAGQWAMAVDADGDGDMDLAIPSDVAVEEDWVTINLLLLNDGSGHFSALLEDAWPPSPRYDLPGFVQDALIYDFNNDLLDDLLLYKTSQAFTEPFAQVLISNGDGTFRDETQIRLPPIDEDIRSFQLHDLDQDGHKDFFVWVGAFEGGGDGYADIRINDGDGFFRELERDWVSGIGNNWRVLDVDGDGGTDWFVQESGYTLSKMILPYGPELDGTAGDNRLIGGAHDNVFRGLAGNDVLDGGLGDDQLDGGPGDDTLIGGKGNDWYIYHSSDLGGHDTISDKLGSTDRLRFDGFGLGEVILASQGENGELILDLADGGSITVDGHFQGGDFGIEKLRVGAEFFDIPGDPSFQSGSIDDLLNGGQNGFEMNPGLNGNWWNGLDRNGEGVQVEVSDGGDGSLIMVATIYSYDDMGKQIFLIAVGTVNGDTVDVDVFITEGGLWGENFDPALVNETQWGTGTFSASSCDAMHMSLMPNAQFQDMGYTDLMYDLIRLTTPAVPCPVENSN